MTSKILRFFLKTIALLFAVIFLSIASYGYFLYTDIIEKEPVLSKVEFLRSKKDYVRYEDISSDFLNAIYSIEDRRFYTHGAVDYLALIRAVIRNIERGELTEGGSTITQQLAKNMYFSHKRSFSRKLAEFYIAHELEKVLSKKEILELYVNIIYYGDGHYGISQASHGYFHKMPKELTLNEASLLAGLPNAPSLLSLSKNYAGAQRRQQEVLEAMLDTRTISQEDFESFRK
ncbi:MAG: biosynthetic peptidoglycan transglycosylase [Filifactor alocis]|nr:biosynthetic peptidoglycan transglycosylase [Filifactor alocis]